MTKPTSQFLFATCQVGAEPALKAELLRARPDARLAFSRPGFVTFKLADAPAGLDFVWPGVFARASGLALRRATGDDDAARAADAVALAAEVEATAIHVWQRDTATPGFRRFEPGPTEAAADVRAAIELALAALPTSADRPPITVIGGEVAPQPDAPQTNDVLPSRLHPFQPTPRGAVILDCILVEPDQWWLGLHRADALPTRWPGGMRPVVLPPHAVSRAYLKMEEALAWSRFPTPPGDIWAELGCSPGGASQALLDRGLRVLGIDPAEVDPSVAAYPNFFHIRRRSKDVPRRDLAGVRFIAADMNVAPNYTLDSIEDLLSNRHLRIDGLLLTLKLPEWELADDVPAYLARIRGWGFRDVHARQLQHNRQEICVAALRSTNVRKRRSTTAPRRQAKSHEAK